VVVRYLAEVPEPFFHTEIAWQRRPVAGDAVLLRFQTDSGVIVRMP
jgi:hypothetical protein